MKSVLIFLSLSYVTGKTSSLVCTSSIDIKKCILDNEDRISEVVAKNAELSRVTHDLSEEVQQKSFMVKQFNNSLFEFITKSDHEEDYQSLKLDIARLADDEQRTNQIQNQLSQQKNQIEKINNQISELQNDDTKSSLSKMIDELEKRLMSSESEYKRLFDIQTQKSKVFEDQTASEGQKIKKRLDQSDADLKMLQGQLKLMEDAINDEKTTRNNDLQSLMEITEKRLKNASMTSENDESLEKIEAKTVKNQAEIKALKSRIDDIETRSKDEHFPFPVEQVPNDQNAFDSMKSRIDKIEYDVEVLKRKTRQDKTRAVYKNINKVTAWVKEVLRGIGNDLNEQEEKITNLTVSIEEKDRVINSLQADLKNSMEDSKKLRQKLFESDLDRDLRLGRLELAVKGSEERQSVNKKIRELEEWKESAVHILNSMQARLDIMDFATNPEDT